MIIDKVDEVLTILMASYFIRNDYYSKSKPYVAFKLSIYRYYVSSSFFA